MPKTLLRYPGGKSRAIHTLRSYLPAEVKEICSPFFGGGAFELDCAERGMSVYGSDLFEPLANFWYCALLSPDDVADRVRMHYPLSRERFRELQRDFYKLKQDMMERAAVFYVLNRCSYSGLTFSGGFSPGHPRFTVSGIDKLAGFSAPHISMSCRDWKEQLEDWPEMFAFLDPPYANGEKLYGVKGDKHRGFNHEELADFLKQRNNWMLCYNDCEEIRELYEGFKIFKPIWQYSMGKTKSKEIIIMG